MDAYREFLARIGTFFMIIGAFLFILFVSSDFARNPDFDYLFLSMLALGVGWIFRRNKPRPAPAERFSWLRKQRKGRSKHGADKGKEEKK